MYELGQTICLILSVGKTFALNGLSVDQVVVFFQDD